MFYARRLIENVLDTQNGRLILLALDWAKAFDSVSPERLVQALVRFGAPAQFAAAVKSVYTNRRFSVREAGNTSETRAQEFGISQGCPLSPFRFSIIMTVLMHDAKRRFAQTGLQQHPGLPISELMYADDTLLVGADEDYVHKLMEC
eukprot:4011834-Pyramimonas_sp.AAC.1